jgi:poly(U)-specific endoribonuclease
MDVQNSKHPCDKDDAAHDPLFTHVNTQIFATRPTYHAFKQLLDNYTVDTRTREEVTERERDEVHAFLNAILETAPMKYCHQYCLVNDASYEGRSVPRDENEFVKILETMWFELYSRSGCGFEHVFVGEVSESAGALFSTYRLESNQSTLHPLCSELPRNISSHTFYR